MEKKEPHDPRESGATKYFDEVEGGYFDKDGFYILPDGDFYDPDGYYFDVDGYDETGGYYDDYGEYVPPPTRKPAGAAGVADLNEEDERLIAEYEMDEYEEEFDEQQEKEYQAFLRQEKTKPVIEFIRG